MAWVFGNKPPAATPRPIAEPEPAHGGGLPPAPQEENLSPGRLNVDLTTPGANPLQVYTPQSEPQFGGDLAGQAVGAAVGALGIPFQLAGTLANWADKLIGGGINATLGSPAQASQWRVLTEFGNSPDTPDKRRVQAEMAQYQGDPFKQSQLAFEYLDHTNAYLMPELWSPTDSTASGIAWSMLQSIGAPASQVVGRTIAGSFGEFGVQLGAIPTFTKETHFGGDRLSNIKARFYGSPEAAATVTETERYALQQVETGHWNHDQGLDFLAGHSAGFSRDMGTELITAMVTDPTIVLPFVGAVGKAAGVGARLGEAAANGSRIASYMLGSAGRLNDILDPVGAIFGRAAPRSLMPPGELDELGRAVPFFDENGREIVNAKRWNDAAGLSNDPAGQTASMATGALHMTYGDVTPIFKYFAGKDPSGRLVDLLQRGEATANANMTLRSIVNRFRGNRLLTAGQDELAQLAQNTTVDSIVDDAIAGTASNVEELVTLEQMRLMQPVETLEDRVLLAERVSRSFGGTPEEAASFLAGLSPKQLSYMHLVTYGLEDAQLLNSVGRLLNAGVTIGKKLSPQRLILLNSKTLTSDAAARLVREVVALEAEGTPESLQKAAGILREGQVVYPQLAKNFPLNGEGNDLAEQISRLRGWLEMQLRAEELPAELSAKEAADLRAAAPELTEMHLRGQAGGAPWKLGVAPDELHRMGMYFDGLQWRISGDVWTTHRAATSSAYRPLSLPLRFVNGRIASYASNKVADAVDLAENITRTLSQSITSAIVTENARVRLTGQMRKLGMDKTEAQKLFHGVLDLVTDRQAPIRSLTPHDIWHELGPLIPQRLINNRSITRTTLMGQILEAWQGDFRIVGATQYLTGGLKRVDPGRNLVGILAEKVVPFLRFSISPIFQAQQRVEGMVWLTMRGIIPAFGVTANREDFMLLNILKRLAETSGHRVGDMDHVVEMTNQARLGHEIAEAMGDGRWSHLWDQVSNARGSEQLNYLRSIKHDIYNGVRELADKNGIDFEEMISHYRDTSIGGTPWGNGIVNRLPSDDDAVVRWLHEIFTQTARPDDVVVPGERVVNTTAEAAMYAPHNMGEHKLLDIDGYLRSYPMLDSRGATINSESAMRDALTGERISLDQVRQNLTELGVPAANIDRFTRGLTFSWSSFWTLVAKQFNASHQEIQALQRMIIRLADAHGVKPLDYLSQLISPVIERGDDALIKHIGDGLSVLRTAEKGGGTSEQLMGQLAKIFVANLHPSAQETLLAEFRDQLPKLVNGAYTEGDPEIIAHYQEMLAGLNGAWSEADTERLTQELLARMRGQGPAQAELPLEEAGAGAASPAPASSSGMPQGPKQQRLDLTGTAAEAGPVEAAGPMPQGPGQQRLEPVPAGEAAPEAGPMPQGPGQQRLGINEPVAAPAAPERRAVVSTKESGPLAAKWRKEGYTISIDASDPANIVVTGTKPGAAAPPAVAATGVAPKTGELAAIDGARAKVWAAQDAVPEVPKGKQPSAVPGYVKAQRAADKAMDDYRKALQVEVDAGRMRPEEANLHFQRAQAGERGQEYQRKLDYFERRLKEIDQELQGNPKYPGTLEEERGRILREQKLAQVRLDLVNGKPPDVSFTRDELVVEPVNVSGGTGGHRADIEVTLPEHLGMDPYYRYVTGPGRVTVRQEGTTEAAAKSTKTANWKVVRPVRDAEGKHLWNPETHKYEYEEIATGLTRKQAIERAKDWLVERNAPAPAAAAEAAPEAVAAAPKPVPAVERAKAKVTAHEAQRDPGPVTAQTDEWLKRADQLSREYGARLQEAVDKGQMTREEAVAHLRQTQSEIVAGRAPVATAAQPAVTQLPPRPAAMGPAPVPPAPPASHPDVERIYQYFAKWVREAVTNGLLDQSTLPAETRQVLNEIGLQEVAHAKPFNHSEARFFDAVIDYMAQKENDAFSMIYWRRSRSFAERSINHPMFGIYPASYMWGKVAPNFIRFLARDPFGLETGVGVNVVRNTQMALAARREFDPNFQAQMDALGASKALWFAGYMLPGVPWDLTAAAPGWLQELFRQADDNAARVRNGLEPKPIDLRGLLDSENTFLSITRSLASGAEGISEAQRAVGTEFDRFLDQVSGRAGQQAPLSQPVRATGLQPILSEQQQRLQQELGIP